VALAGVFVPSSLGSGLLLLLLLLYSRTGPRKALSLKLSDTRVYEPEKRTRLGRNRELCTLLRARHPAYRASSPILYRQVV